MIKVFLASTDRIFSKRMKSIPPDHLKLSYGNRNSDGERINKALAGDSDLVFMDFDYIHYLRKMLPKAKVIVA